MLLLEDDVIDELLKGNNVSGHNNPVRACPDEIYGTEAKRVKLRTAFDEVRSVAANVHDDLHLDRRRIRKRQLPLDTDRIAAEETASGTCRHGRIALFCPECRGEGVTTMPQQAAVNALSSKRAATPIDDMEAEHAHQRLKRRCFDDLQLDHQRIKGSTAAVGTDDSNLERRMPTMQGFDQVSRPTEQLLVSDAPT